MKNKKLSVFNTADDDESSNDENNPQLRLNFEIWKLLREFLSFEYFGNKNNPFTFLLELSSPTIKECRNATNIGDFLRIVVEFMKNEYFHSRR